jgi:hypothetical protein
MAGAAIKKQEEATTPFSSEPIHVGRDVVINASRLTNATIGQHTDEILQQVLKELEKKKHST